MSTYSNKRPVFIIVLPDKRDIEFIDPLAIEREKKANKEPIDRTSQYDNMLLIYRDPHSAVFDEERKKDPTRGYHDKVFKCASEDRGTYSVIEIPKDRKKEAIYVLRVCQKLNSNSYLDVHNGLSFDEVPDEVAPAKK